MKAMLQITESSLDTVAEAQFKENPQKSRSYNYVSESLKTDTPLSVIAKKASQIEWPIEIKKKIKYYTQRLPSKIMEVIGIK